jgi:hypothetical protein
MTFDEITGVLSGTPTASGELQFKITASDGVNPDVSKNYTLVIAAAGAALPPASLLDTVVSPVGAGTTTGDGSYDVGANATVTATAVPGFSFLNWTDNGKIVSTNTSYTLAMDVNHSLVANFVPDVVQWSVTTSAAPAAAGTTTGTGMVDDGTSVTVVATANAGYVLHPLDRRRPGGEQHSELHLQCDRRSKSGGQLCLHTHHQRERRTRRHGHGRRHNGGWQQRHGDSDAKRRLYLCELD